MSRGYDALSHMWKQENRSGGKAGTACPAAVREQLARQGSKSTLSPAT